MLAATRTVCLFVNLIIAFEVGLPIADSVLTRQHLLQQSEFKEAYQLDSQAKNEANSLKC